MKKKIKNENGEDEVIEGTVDEVIKYEKKKKNKNINLDETKITKKILFD